MSEWQRDSYVISTEQRRLDLDVVHGFLTKESYWAQNRSRAVQEKAIANSLCFGVYEGTSQVGFARVVTDYATFGWICDLFVLAAHRKRGLSKWLVECMLSSTELAGLRRLVLLTRDAHGLYKRYGEFKALSVPERWLERLGPEGT